MATDMSALEDFVLERMGKTHLSSVAMAVVKNGEVIYQRGFGLANREKGIPATPETNYCIGSVTKSFTCLGIMQLQEKGLLSIGDPVEKFLPLQVKPSGEAIRIKHLMSHTSGIPALAYLENLLRYHHGAIDYSVPVASIDDMLAFVNGAADWVVTKPGERWFYLNEGFILLGGIIEKVSCQPYATYIREHILLPLGMTRSFHDYDLAKADKQMATPYALDKDNRHIAREYPWGQAQADGGLISNALDMAKYVTMYLNNGRGPGGPIVSPESIATMSTPVVRTPNEDIATGSPAAFYGLGLNISDFLGHRSVGHSGAMYVSTAGMRFLPELRIGGVALVNGSGYAPMTMVDFALAQVIGKDPWELEALRAEKVLEGLTGYYETYKSTHRAEVRRDGDYLIVENKHNYGSVSSTLVPFDLDPAHPRFYLYGSGHRQVIEFFCSGDSVQLLHERYLCRKTGKLQS